MSQVAGTNQSSNSSFSSEQFAKPLRISDALPRSQPLVPIVRVDEWELRRIFNQLRIPERAEGGELRMEVKRSTPARDSAIRNLMPGTLSQQTRYYDLEKQPSGQSTPLPSARPDPGGQRKGRPEACG